MLVIDLSTVGVTAGDQWLVKYCDEVSDECKNNNRCKNITMNQLIPKCHTRISYRNRSRFTKSDSSNFLELSDESDSRVLEDK